MREIQSCTTIIVSLLYFILLFLFFGFNKYGRHAKLSANYCTIEPVSDLFCGQCRNSVDILTLKVRWR